MSIAVQRNKAQLLTLDQVEEKLAITEPLGTIRLDDESGSIRFLLDEDWTTELETAQPSDFVGALVSVDGVEYQLTAEAALQAGAAFGLTGAYVSKTPARLVEPHLNYWYGPGIGNKAFNLLTQGGDKAYAFAKPTTNPFSNLRLLEEVVAQISRRYGTQIMADYKFHHSLTETNIRLVLVDYEIEMDVDLLSDVKAGLDVWSPGIQLTNSLVGKAMTQLDSYFFRWWGTNGATQEYSNWNRKAQGQNLDLVLEWVRETVAELLEPETINRTAAQIENLGTLRITHNLGDVLKEVFEAQKVPVSQRQAIIDELTYTEGEVTMYHLQQALTRTANEPGLSPARVDSLLRIGGELSAQVMDPIKAKVWREGNEAPRGTKSPYEIEVMA